MSACCAGTKGGSRSREQTVQALLGEINKNFLTLIIPDGAEFLNPDPKSHFLRQLDTTWNPENKETAKFLLRQWRDIPFKGVLEDPKTVDWWNPYDLLGLFLSILGPAPPGATKLNYFQPLTAVYGQWCSRVGGPDVLPAGTGAGHRPAVFQATWKPHKPEGAKVSDGFDYFLGSSLAGDIWDEDKTGNWRVRVRKARHDMFHVSLSLTLFNKEDFKPEATSQSFGTCGETYPFIYSFRSNVGENMDLCGLALGQKFIFGGANPKYTYGKIAKATIGPCENCEKLLTGAGALKVNFDSDRGKSKGPKPSQEGTAAMAEGTTPTGEPATMGTAQQSAVTNPPEGWTVDPEQLDVDYYWGTEGDGRAAAKKVGLANPTGQLIVDRHNGADRYIFTTPDNKVYLWNMITYEVFEFTKPTALQDILTQMRMKPGQGKIETKMLHDTA
ncbi:hypothetical protein F4802DRAFT_542305 [Xylaria palmicola]|nr:hypothetical protein F4802DRAFT_542305 [Xylaria palmicola]